jgi:hypothetical protein
MFWALGLALVLSGGVLGGSTVALLDRRPPMVAADRANLPNADTIAARLQSNLGLTSAQTESVRRAMRERLAALAVIRDEVATRVAIEHERLADEMQGILDPDQFDRWRRQFEELRRRRSADITHEVDGRDVVGLHQQKGGYR